MAKEIFLVILRVVVTPIAVVVGSLAATSYAAGPYPHRLGLSAIASVVGAAIATGGVSIIDKPAGSWFVTHLRYSSLLYLLLPLYAVLLQEGPTAPGGRVMVVGIVSAILVNAIVLAVRLRWAGRHDPAPNSGRQADAA